MFDGLGRIWQEIVARPDGPLAFRFYFQPIMAILFATRDGWHDAQAGRPAYFWALFTDPAGRGARVRDGWRSVGKICILALVLDTIYQFVVLGGLRPVEGMVVAVLLAIVPYVLTRGPVNRLVRRRQPARPRPSPPA